jgi:hypothetical protein
VQEVTSAAATAGGSNRRKAKDLLAIYHEDAGVPAGLALGLVLHAESMIRLHIKQAGAAAALNLAIEALDETLSHIVGWREADQKRCNYPYQRMPRGHA